MAGGHSFTRLRLSSRCLVESHEGCRLARHRDNDHLSFRADSLETPVHFPRDGLGDRHIGRGE